MEMECLGWWGDENERVCFPDNDMPNYVSRKEKDKISEPYSKNRHFSSSRLWQLIQSIDLPPELENGEINLQSVDASNFPVGTASDSIIGGRVQFVRTFYSSQDASIVYVLEQTIHELSTATYEGLFIARGVPKEELSIFN